MVKKKVEPVVEQAPAPAPASELALAAPAAAVAVIQKTPAERAAVVLGSTKREIDLAALALKSVDIKEVLNADGRAQVHRMAMDLKDARCAITNDAKDARDDATKFSRAVIAEEARLIAIIKDEETRVFKLRDDFDEKVAAEKAEADRIEAARVAALRARVNSIIGLPASVAGAASIDIFNVLRDLAARDVATEGFAELADEALAAVNAAGIELNAMYEAAQLNEEAEADRLAEIEAQRVALAEQAEKNRIEAARLAEERRLQAAEDEARRARAKSEADAQARAAAEAQRKLDEQAAEVEAQRKQQEADAAALAARMAAFEAAQQKEIDHGEALEENARRDADAKMVIGDSAPPEFTPVWEVSVGTITQDGLWTPPAAPEPVAEVAVEVEPETAPAPAVDVQPASPAAGEIVDLVAEFYSVSPAQALIWLIGADFAGVDLVDQD